jgi:hypothetical protein
MKDPNLGQSSRPAPEGYFKDTYSIVHKKPKPIRYDHHPSTNHQVTLINHIPQK